MATPLYNILHPESLKNCVICTICSLPFPIKGYPHRIKRSKDFFCSVLCRMRWYEKRRNITEKKCSTCKEVFPIENFGIASYKKCGRVGSCIECISEKRKKSYWKDPEKFRSRHKADTQKHKEKRDAYDKKYKRDNREAILKKKKESHKKTRVQETAYVRRKRQENPLIFLEKERQRRKDNPELFKFYKATRRARQRNAPIVDLTRSQWEFLKKLYNYRCVYCGTKPKRLTKDHITPLINGGSHTMENIVPACGSCNSRKGKGAVLVPIQPALGLKL